jgi:glutaconate CoA-transferase subunit A
MPVERFSGKHVYSFQAGKNERKGISTMQSSKLLTAKEAVSRFINDGDTVTIGGFFHAVPHSLTQEIIRQGKKNLTICGSSMNEQADQLIGAGCVDRMVTSYAWLEVYGPLYCMRRSVENNVPHRVHIEDYSNFAMTIRFMAGALGVPYMPLNSIKGSDMVTHSDWMKDGKLKILDDPFGSGVQHALVPALRPDVGYMHAQRADTEGNVQMWGILGDAPWSLRACKKIVVSVEEIVSREEIGRDPNRTILPGYRVSAVVEEPFGAHPKHTQGFYREDRDFIFEYVKRSKLETDWLEYMDEWVYGVSDRTEYIEKYIKKYGFEKFMTLQAKNMNSCSVDYGY